MKKLILLFALLAISANAINCLKVPENYMPDSVYNPFEKGVTIDYYTKGHFDSTVTRYTDTDSIEVERNFFENITYIDGGRVVILGFLEKIQQVDTTFFFVDSTFTISRDSLGAIINFITETIKNDSLYQTYYNADMDSVEYQAITTIDSKDGLHCSVENSFFSNGNIFSFANKKTMEISGNVIAVTTIDDDGEIKDIVYYSTSDPLSIHPKKVRPKVDFEKIRYFDLLGRNVKNKKGFNLQHYININ
ncbi:MAG: hypothetical protein MJY82_08675 [Fibrobacter sp.]|nr:hypothetical protein [Fibrobacter sp.]